MNGQFFGFATKEKIAFLWKYSLPGEYRHVSLSGDGSNICISIDTEDDSKPDDRLFFFNDKGKLLWKKRTSGRSWGEVSKDGKYILCNVMENIIGEHQYDNVYYLYDRKGNPIWRKEDWRDLSFSENGKFIFSHFASWGESGPSLVSIYNLDGSLYWEYDVKMEIAHAEMSNDGNYFVVLGPVQGRNKRVFLYSKEGVLIWDYRVGSDIVPSDSVEISEDSQHVICTAVGELYLFDISGKLLWKGSALKKKLPGIYWAWFVSKDIIEIVTGKYGEWGEWGKKYHVNLKGEYWEPKVIQEDTIASEYLKKTGDKPYDIVISSDGKSGVVVSTDKKSITYFKIRK